MNRTLYFGGSFNPIHHGHLICGRAVAEAAAYDRIILLPAGQPPHKPNLEALVPAEHRLQMCRLAVAGSGLFEMNSIELKRAGPSYTIDTARELGGSANGKIDWLIGADMLLYLPKWHRAVELMDKVNFVVMSRPGWSLDWDTLPKPFRALRANVVEAPMIDIHATDIRRRVAAGLGVEYLTPLSVCSYIQQHRLYQSTPPQ